MSSTLEAGQEGGKGDIEDQADCGGSQVNDGEVQTCMYAIVAYIGVPQGFQSDVSNRNIREEMYAGSAR